MPIQFKGLKNLIDDEQEIVRKLSREYYDKILRELKDALLILDIKTYNEEGSKIKYAFHARVESKSTLALVSKASDWDLKRTLHKLFQKLEREAQHKYKSEGKKY